MKFNHKKLNIVLGLVIVLMASGSFWMNFKSLQNVKQDYCETCVSNYKNYRDRNKDGISRISYADGRYAIKVNRDVNSLQKNGTGNFFDAFNSTSYFMNILKHNLSDKYKEIEYYQRKDEKSVNGIIWQDVDYRGITNNILFIVKEAEKSSAKNDRFYLEVAKHPECEKGTHIKGQSLCKDEELILTSEEIETIIDEVLKRAGY